MPKTYKPPFPAPASVTVTVPADDAAWRASRGKDVTASVAGALLGIHDYTTPYKLWADKTGRTRAAETESRAMRRGTKLEPVAIEILREDYPEWDVVYRNDRAYYRDPVARIGATPDAFAVRPGYAGHGAVQVKTVSREAFRDSWVDPDTRDVHVPLWIAVQAIVEAKLTGASWAAVVALIWNIDALDLHVIDVPIHERTWSLLRKRVDEFWAVVESGEEVDPDWQRDGRVVMDVYGDTTPGRADLTGLYGIDAVIERYREAGAIIRANEKIREELKPQLIYALGNQSAGYTEAWELNAPTTFKQETIVRATQFRALRIKPRRSGRG